MRYLAFFFFLLLSFQLTAQELFFSPASNFQDLPSLETYDILQDRKGFLWITTDAGICRYEGSKLTVFTVKDGIPENVVFKAYEDDKGRIWFSTLSGYFFYYYDKSFHTIGANEELKKLCHSLPINSFFVGKNDTLFGALGGGSVGGTRSTIKIPPKNNYSTICIDTSAYPTIHRYVITNKLHLNEFLMGSGGIKRVMNNFFPLLYNGKTIDIHIKAIDGYSGNGSKAEMDGFGNLYVQTGRQLNIITRQGTTKGYYYFKDKINSCYVDYKNDLWVCTINGGYLFKNADVTKPPIRFLNNMPLSSALLDREGTLWVATLEKGVVRCVNTGIVFFNEEKEKPASLQKNSQQLNITYKSRKIISVFKNDSLIIYDKLKSFQNIPVPMTLSFLEGEILYLVAGTNLSAISMKKTNPPVILHNNVTIKEILTLGKDSMLFMTTAHLLIRSNNKNKIVHSPFPMRTITQLNNKKIIVSSRNNSGIYEFKENNFFPYLPHLPELKTRINCITEDNQGNIWFATNEYGLYCYDHKKRLHHYSLASGLGSDKINSLAIDSKNNLWLGSYNGLTKLSFSNDLQNIQIKNFNKSHGIPNVQIESLIAFNGKIVCLSKDLCFYFQEDELKKNTIPPLNYIASVTINDIPYSIKNKPILSYDQNNLRVQALLVTYKNTEQRTFLYKLIGYDKNWHASATGEIRYTNLPHGQYVLTIYGLNNDNIISNRPAIFSFIIKKPFWLTWWFILLEVLLFSVIFYFVFRFWKRRIQKRAHDKALINQKIAEFKMTALRSQMNPHFVFNAISSIQHYILKQDTFKSYNYLAKFSLLIRTILDNSKEEYIALSQEINTLKLYIELEQIRFKQPFQFILDVDEELQMDTYIPTMLIQPYVENSIWHGLMPKKTNCILQLALTKKETHIFVSIKDNGVGRNYVGKKSSLHESKGMSITQQRIQELENSNEKKFDVTILDLTDEKGNAAGTEVQIIIPFDL